MIAVDAAAVLTFDAETHTYRAEGRIVPSVTQVLKETGLSDDFARVPVEILEHKRQLGHAVHAACHYLDEGDLDESTVAPDVRPYVEGWRRFLADTGFTAALLETRVYHPAYRYAGTFDRLGTIESGLHRFAVLADIKTGQAASAAAHLQLAAYAEALPTPHPRMPACRELLRWSVELKPTGDYTLNEYSARTQYSDFGVFRAALTVVHYKRAHGGAR